MVILIKEQNASNAMLQKLLLKNMLLAFLAAAELVV